MSDELLRLEDLDADGALAEAADAAMGRTRADLLRATALGGAAAFGTLLLPDGAAAKPGRRDVAILNFALVLEYLQADFYTEAERAGALNGETRRQARVVGAHERAHVKAFRDTLGRRAAKRPSFDFRGVTEREGRFRRTAVALEDLSVAAYAGQVPNIRDPGYLQAAVGILSVEARHAAWIRRLAGQSPAATATDKPRSKAGTTRLIRQTRFISTRPRTSSRKRPKYTG